MRIAIDGPAASGKGTLARKIAEHYKLVYLDTGSLYRAVARDVRRAGLPLESEPAAIAAARALDPVSLSDPGLRDPGVGDAASIVASHAGVRTALLQFQRDVAARKPGAVLDGRDIGTVVLPDADAKIFVTADLSVRARRRFEELVSKGEAITYDRVLSIITKRDARDSDRAAAPMKPAADASVLDTTHLSIEDALAAAVRLIDAQQGR